LPRAPPPRRTASSAAGSTSAGPAVPALRKLEEHKIRTVYFAGLCCYATFGIISLTLWNPVQLLKWAGNIYNAALGFSCFHVLAVNLILLPKPLRPGWFIRIGLVVSGCFLWHCRQSRR
jgi:hypothetical protein